MIKKHYKSDFTIMAKLLKDDSGVPYPFTIKLRTLGSNNYIASWDGTTSINLLNDPTSADDYATIKLDKHNLKVGVIHQETTFFISDEDWKNGIIYKTFAGATGYELVSTKDDIDGVDATWPIEYDINLIRGAAFTYDDFTAEQIATLQQPATDAAATADLATENANAAAEKIENMDFKIDNGDLIITI